MGFGKKIKNTPEGKHVGERTGRGKKAKARLKSRDNMGHRGTMTMGSNPITTSGTAVDAVKGKNKGRTTKG